MKCDKCWFHSIYEDEIKLYKQRQAYLLESMELACTLVELWGKVNRLISLGDLSREDAEEEFANGKEKLRVLFDRLIESGETSFLDSLLRALHLPENHEQFLQD